MNEIIALGIVLSLIYTEVIGISPGGIIVPAYFSLFLNDPKKILYTLIISILCFFIVKFLSNFMILFGRRKFAIYVLAGIFLKALLSYIYYENIFNFYNLSISIGYIIPGILAKDFEKQGFVITLASLFIVIFTIKILQIAFIN